MVCSVGDDADAGGRDVDEENDGLNMEGTSLLVPMVARGGRRPEPVRTMLCASDESAALSKPLLDAGQEKGGCLESVRG